MLIPQKSITDAKLVVMEEILGKQYAPHSSAPTETIFLLVITGPTAIVPILQAQTSTLASTTTKPMMAQRKGVNFWPKT